MWTDDEIETAIRQLPYVPAEYRDAQSARIVGHLMPMLQRLAPGLCRRNADLRGALRDDLGAELGIRVLLHLRAYARGEKHTGIILNWMAFIARLASREARQVFETDTYRPAGMSVGDVRRHRQLPAFEEKLRAQLGREPSDQELVDYNNSEISRRHADPKRHGSLVTLAQVKQYRGY